VLVAYLACRGEVEVPVRAVDSDEGIHFGVGQASVTPESSCGVFDPCARRRFVQLLRRSRMAGCFLDELYP